MKKLLITESQYKRIFLLEQGARDSTPNLSAADKRKLSQQGCGGIWHYGLTSCDEWDKYKNLGNAKWAMDMGGSHYITGMLACNSDGCYDEYKKALSFEKRREKFNKGSGQNLSSWDFDKYLDQQESLKKSIELSRKEAKKYNKSVQNIETFLKNNPKPILELPLQQKINSGGYWRYESEPWPHYYNHQTKEIIGTHDIQLEKSMANLSPALMYWNTTEDFRKVLNHRNKIGGHMGWPALTNGGLKVVDDKFLQKPNWSQTLQNAANITTVYDPMWVITKLKDLQEAVVDDAFTKYFKYKYEEEIEKYNINLKQYYLSPQYQEWMDSQKSDMLKNYHLQQIDGIRKDNTVSPVSLVNIAQEIDYEDNYNTNVKKGEGLDIKDNIKLKDGEWNITDLPTIGPNHPIPPKRELSEIEKAIPVLQDLLSFISAHNEQLMSQDLKAAARACKRKVGSSCSDWWEVCGSDCGGVWVLQSSHDTKTTACRCISDWCMSREILTKKCGAGQGGVIFKPQDFVKFKNSREGWEKFTHTVNSCISDYHCLIDVSSAVLSYFWPYGAIAGSVLDLINAGSYVIEGKDGWQLNALMSMIGVIPGVGEMKMLMKGPSKSFKTIGNITKQVKDLGKNATKKQIDDVVFNNIKNLNGKEAINVGKYLETLKKHSVDMKGFQKKLNALSKTDTSIFQRLLKNPKKLQKYVSKYGDDIAGMLGAYKKSKGFVDGMIQTSLLGLIFGFPEETAEMMLKGLRYLERKTHWPILRWMGMAQQTDHNMDIVNDFLREIQTYESDANNLEEVLKTYLEEYIVKYDIDREELTTGPDGEGMFDYIFKKWDGKVDITEVIIGHELNNIRDKIIEVEKELSAGDPTKEEIITKYNEIMDFIKGIHESQDRVEELEATYIKNKQEINKDAILKVNSDYLLMMNSIRKKDTDE
jgi:hypothetical protein